MVIKDNNLGTERQKKAQIFNCVFCNYNTCYKSKWLRHNDTKKHKDNTMATNDNNLGNLGNLGNNEHIFICPCGKKYLHRSGLSRHKKSCTYESPVIEEQEPQNQIISTSTSEQIEILRKENKALLEQMNIIVQSLADVAKIAGNNNTISTNSHNINFYLNTHCKDAMSIQSFTKQLAIDISKHPELICSNKDHKQLYDFISERLTILDQTDRPLHSHKKTVYLKDEQDGWNKDTEGVAANTVIGAAKKADLDKLQTLYPAVPTNDKQQEEYIQTVSCLTGKISKKEKDQFEKMNCIELDIE